ncbi:MAG: hypothetical protein Q7U02_05060 [Desulfosalsimonadaceae bacterium]|nr:hypothetical protein [Desulfosalsimonadaceae bacterium]
MGVYLCQVSETVSCGACCGLYNVADASFEDLSQMLARRSRVFSALPRTMDAILDFGRAETANLGVPPMPEFHHCPYIGFIGDGFRRVGCLLHPQAHGNSGVDYRGLSHYGSMTCGMYFCPSHRNLPDDFKQVLRDLADDWYGYGLMISEPVLLEALYEEIIKRTCGAKPDPERAGQPENRPLWAELFALKIRWPYQTAGRPLANYFFNDPLYPKPPVDYENLAAAPSRFDILFRELHSHFTSPSELMAAERYLDRLLDDLAATIT